MTKDVSQLLEQRNALDTQIEEAISKTKDEVISRIKVDIENYRLVAEDLFPGIKLKKKTAKTVEAKYKNSETGQTWTGRGKRPLWLKDKDLEQYKV